MCCEPLFSFSAMSLHVFYARADLTHPNRRVFSSSEINKVFSGSALAFCCSRSSLFFLKDCATAEEWKRAAEGDPARARDQLLLLSVAALPTSRLRNPTYNDLDGVPRGECNPCYQREMRKKRRRSPADGLALLLNGDGIAGAACAPATQPRTTGGSFVRGGPATLACGRGSILRASRGALTPCVLPPRTRCFHCERRACKLHLPCGWRHRRRR